MNACFAHVQKPFVLVRKRSLIQLERTVPRAMAQAVSSGENHVVRPKLTGRAFYQSIGSPKVILAPMVDRSEFVRQASSPYSRQMLTLPPGMETPHPILPR